MTDQEFESAKTLKALMTSLNNSHTQLTASGARAKITIVNANGTQELIHEATIIAILGQPGYNTIAAAAKTSIATGVNDAISAKQAEFTSLGASQGS